MNAWQRLRADWTKYWMIFGWSVALEHSAGTYHVSDRTDWLWQLASVPLPDGRGWCLSRADTTTIEQWVLVMRKAGC